METTVQKNEKNEILIDPRDISDVADDSYQRRGGWTKTITGLDKTKTNGFSLQGSFMNGPEWVPVGGLILGCSHQGSYNKPKNDTRYFLCQIQNDGSLIRIVRVTDQKSWATDLWPSIEKALASIQIAEAPNPLAEFSNEEILMEIHRRGLIA